MSAETVTAARDLLAQADDVLEVVAWSEVPDSAAARAVGAVVKALDEHFAEPDHNRLRAAMSILLVDDHPNEALVNKLMADLALIVCLTDSAANPESRMRDEEMLELRGRVSDFSSAVEALTARATIARSVS